MSKVALLMCGGGSRGIVEFGYLKAFVELGLDYNSIYSSSVGTLNSLLFYPGDMDWLEKLWVENKSKKVYRHSPPHLFGSNPSLFDSTPLKNIIQEAVEDHNYIESEKEFYINATDLTNGISIQREVKQLSKEDLVLFSLGSASPPVFFPPVKYHGIDLCDSGVANNYGISNAMAGGCDIIILMLPARFVPQKINNIIDAVSATVSISMNSYLQREKADLDTLNKYCEGGITLVPIEPDVDFKFGFLDFDFTGYDPKELIKYGYNLAKPILQKYLC